MNASFLASGQLRYFLFVALVFLGPTFGVFQLKAVHLIASFVLLSYILLALKNDRIRVADAKFIILLLFTSFVYLIFAFYNGYLNQRYILYFFYFLISAVTLFFSFKAVQKLDNHTLYLILNTFIYVDLTAVLLELVANMSIFSLYPLAGTEYQVGSSLWANVNTNIVALIIANTSLYFIGKPKHCFINFIPIVVFAALVDAKLCIIAILGQILFFSLYANKAARVWFLLGALVFLPIVYALLQPYFRAAFVAIDKAIVLIQQPEILQDIVSQGNMFSIAIRAYALSEMFEQLLAFGPLNWILGDGFGSINITFVNNQWGGEINFFAPHFFYLEMFIYAGVFYYVFFIKALSLLSGAIPWKGILLCLPTFGAIVAISSAVYFLPFYFFLAVISLWKTEHKIQT